MTTSHAPTRPSSRDKAERLRRLRATACSTVVQRDEPQTVCAGEPVMAAAADAGQFIVVDMAHPVPKPPHNPRQEPPAAPQEKALSVPAARETPTIPVRERTSPPAGVPIFRLDAAEPSLPRPALVRVAKGDRDPLAPASAALGPCVLPVSEACRSLCRKLRAKLPPGAAAVAWVRPIRETGHAPRLVELAQAMLAHGAKRVLLIDADLAAGRISQMFDLATAQGLEESLKHPSEARRLLRPTGIQGLDVLSRGDGRTLHVPGRVRVSRDTWQRMLADLKSTHDIILIDAACDDELHETPHVLPLAAVADAVCVAITLEHTPRRQALDLVERLQAEAAKLLGCILLNSPAHPYLSAAA